MTLGEFCALCRELEATRSRLAKTALAAEFLRRLTPDEIAPAVAFLAGRPFPTSDPRVLEASWATLSELLASLGPAPAASSLTLLDVARGFADVADASGPGSRRRKAGRLGELFNRASAEEREVLPKILLGEMRIGLHDGLIQEALARAAGADPELVRRAALFLSDLSEVGRIALSEGPQGLEGVGVRLFVPLLPMLAELSQDFAEVFEAHGGRTALEFKYDGARIQLHKLGERVRIWSRRLTEVTASLPEVVAIARRELRSDSLVLDGEVVAVGRDGRPLPFQELMRRFRRIHDLEAAAREVPVALYFFDCLLADGRSLVDEPYEARWTQLERVTGGAYLARRTTPADASAAGAFLAQALAAGHEGVMAKALASPYAPGSRGKRWFKIKPAETLDCVIVAADRGSGRRRGWLSNYHLAVADGTGGFAPVGKTFKGLTDAEFAAMTARLRGLEVADDGYTVTVRPEVVVEVAYNEIQRSPQYPSGFALRFARIARIREDKGPEQATTLAELRGLYERQFAAKSSSSRGASDEPQAWQFEPRRFGRAGGEDSDEARPE
ncbi:MAG: ATP-dependent DNA ligase [Candidatus Rokubacteria bacterium]|nr:ATP-dependent DNA ligase [Candidatus Rokubacteria bacterium]